MFEWSLKNLWAKVKTNQIETHTIIVKYNQIKTFVRNLEAGTANQMAKAAKTQMN